MNPWGTNRRSRICESGGEERARGWVNTWEVRTSDSPNWVRETPTDSRGWADPTRPDFPDSPPDMARLSSRPEGKKRDLRKIARERLHCWVGKVTWGTAGLPSEHGSQRKGHASKCWKGKKLSDDSIPAKDTLQNEGRVFLRSSKTRKTFH